ncbi:DNA mismatch repair protein MutS [Aquimarina atlantica]|uniref:DNA mismatch repair protein MutS n=1 Tax=Aquimarina atlantica TaxID=1317122 RepID=A0A023BMW2_9FLAO|nr:DNA mismatch repair protein MutS [Aquimarina atlantica]EZH71405.1 DNA mismatch repair protein MutS [Aquimarina atlantica]
MNNPQQFYKEQISLHTVSLKKIKKQLAISSIIRLFVFLAIIAGIYFGYPNTQIIIGSSIIGITAFIFLVNRHTDLSYSKNKLQKLIDINTLELDIFEGDVTKLTPGKEYIDATHPYSHDIDLFGEQSFFQYANRTTTLAGKNKLAAILSANAIEHIEKKQEAIKNISKLPEWRQEFSAIASLVNVSVSVSLIQKWLQNYTAFVPKVMRILPAIVSGISLILLTLLFLNMITFTMFLIWFFIGLGITGTQLKKINKLYSNANKVKDTFEQYYKLVDKIENANFEAALLQEKQQLVISDKEKASQTLKQFASILNAFDQRNNMMFGVLANGLLLWDILQSYRIEQWIVKNHNKVAQWFEVIAFFDAYNSLGNFTFNHPDYIYPKITSNHSILKAKELGHPMLNAHKRIDNDITIDKEQFLIITGANMAGKSTFLRTVALQIVMSNMGLPICAKSCEYRPIKLISSMRTSDSLSDDASYFFSELTQLKKIVNALEKDEYFIILDEILKGTNSKDKAAGSRKFVEKLVKAKATGIIATHDLSLCEIASELHQVENRFFDAQIVNDELFFDYKFKDGVCQNMNASFLLKKMGIV